MRMVTLSPASWALSSRGPKSVGTAGSNIEAGDVVTCILGIELTKLKPAATAGGSIEAGDIVICIFGIELTRLQVSGHRWWQQ